MPDKRVIEVKRHVKIYMDYFGYGEQDCMLCEVCAVRATDIHHIKFRSQGGTDDITNLIALCRPCHDRAHNDRAFNQSLQEWITTRHGND